MIPASRLAKSALVLAVVATALVAFGCGRPRHSRSMVLGSGLSGATFTSEDGRVVMEFRRTTVDFYKNGLAMMGSKGNDLPTWSERKHCLCVENAEYQVVGNTVRVTGGTRPSDYAQSLDEQLGEAIQGLLGPGQGVVLLTLVQDDQALEYKSEDGSVLRFVRQ